MFRITTMLCAAAILAAAITPIAAPSPAFAKANPAIDQCRALLPYRPASNLGECLSYINAATNESQGEASHECDFLIENDPFTFELLFVTRSECIQAFGSRGHFK
jgi:hypothetical protein